MMKKIPKNRNQRLLLMGAGFIVGIMLLAFIVDNTTFQQVTYNSDAGFDIVISFIPDAQDRGNNLYYFNNGTDTFQLDISISGQGIAIDYVEITQRINSQAAVILVSAHPNVVTYSYFLTMSNIFTPTIFSYQIFARQAGVGVIDDYSFTVECAGYGTDLPVETTTTTTEPAAIIGFELIAVTSIIILIYKRKQK